MSGTALKWIAVVSMFLDHAAEVLLADFAVSSLLWRQIYEVMRGVGRLAFPIYAFLLVEGFLHTRDIKKYQMRLLVFAVLSEIPFDLAVFHTLFYWNYQNVFFTLFLGLLALSGIRAGEQDAAGKGLWKQALAVLLCGGAAQLLKSDYGGFGVFFIVLLYVTRYDKKTQTMLGSISLVWELPAVLAFLPIRMYNGTRGTCRNKYFFYTFYPLHLLILWIIRQICF